MIHIKKISQYFIFTVLFLLILTVNIIRFVGLDFSPPGFHVDELSSAVTIQCLATEGVDALNHPYPLFGDVSYGSPKPPTYIYPAALWTKLFGFSIASFRAISAFVVVITFVGLFSLFGFYLARCARFGLCLPLAYLHGCFNFPESR